MTETMIPDAPAATPQQQPLPGIVLPVRDMLVPYVITTMHRGVFFGYVDPDTNPAMKVLSPFYVRMCVYWSVAVRGMVGLCVHGPDAACRITPAAPFAVLQDCTGAFRATPEAAARWELAPWT